MKKLFFAFILVVFVSSISEAQTLYKEMKNQIDRILSKDEKNWSISKYKNNVTIKDVDEDGKNLTIYGTYDYSNWLEGTTSIKYTAKAKLLLDEVVVTEVCWNYQGSKTCAE